MRNLKKVLALVLALVMALSLMTVAGAATEFQDLDDTTTRYQEAVQVLGALDVFKGYGEKDFAPKRDITRAEVATIIYRIDTQDTGNKQDYLYVNNDYPDVPADHWAAGAIGYCVNKGIIKGYPDGTFKPGNKITGYEVLAMILREVGYDQKNEFSSNWPITVASTARSVGASTTLTSEDSASLNQPATREVVAELLFQTMVNAEMVYPNALWNYRTTNDLQPATGVNNVKDITLGEAKFGLTKGERKTIDKWGRPGYEWLVDADIKWDSNANINGISGGKTVTGGDALTTVEEAYQARYTTAVTECDVAHDVGITSSKTYDTLWINGQKYDATDAQSDASYTVVATNVVTKIGAQGRLTEVYKDRIVMIDTFLARVTGVSAPEYDAQNHLKKNARLTLTVYDNSQGLYPTDSDTGTTDLYMEQKSEFTYADGAKIARGDVILLNSLTTDTNPGWTTEATPTSLGILPTVDTVVTSNAAGKIEYAEIVGKATVVANTKQTYIYLYTSQHEIGGKTYDDALAFYHDPAQDSKSAWNWYLDQYGNVIGSDPVTAVYNYGVITRLWWVNDNMGDGTAHVSVKYMDGTTAENVTLASLTMSSAGVAQTYAPVSGDSAYSATAEVDDILAVQDDKFFVTTNWATNGEKSDDIAGARDLTHIDVIGGHLFRFQADEDGVIDATEVAGNVGDQAGTPDGYTGLYNATTDISKNTPDVTDETWTVRMDDHTQYLIRSGSNYTNYKYEQITGLVNIDNYEEGEVDYVDVDGDNIAEYVYIITSKVDSTREFLFYYNGGRIVENVSNKSWTVYGYVDGEEGSIVIPAKTADVADCKADWIDTIIRATYEGHMTTDHLGDLYQVTTTGGVVDAAPTLVDVRSSEQPLVFNNTYVDAYGNVDDKWGAILVQGEDTKNSFGLGTFWTYDTDDNLLKQYRTTANMKTPTGGFVSNMSGKDAILVYDVTNNQMLQAYIADVYDETQAGKTLYRLTSETIEAAANGGITVTATVEQNPDEDGNATWGAYDGNETVTVGITYTYFSGTDRRTATMEQDVTVTELGSGVTFYPGGLVVDTSITVSATVSNSDIGTQKIASTGIMVLGS